MQHVVHHLKEKFPLDTFFDEMKKMGVIVNLLQMLVYQMHCW